MNDYSIVGLYDHNADSYNKIKEGFKTNKEVAIVHATGTGKSYNALQYAYDNKDKKIIYVVPYNSIIEHLEKIIENNPNLTKDDFKHVEFRTYTSFNNMSPEKLASLEVDALILDEFHHIGAPVWGSNIQTIIDTHPNINVLGMTAYTVRDRGTSYERDMVNPEEDELFSNKVVSNYDLCDAMIDGVLPKPIYRSAYVKLDETLNHLEERINSYDHNSKDYKELSKLLNDCKKRIHEAPGMADVFKQNVKKDGKYIYFCPLNPVDGVNDIDTIKNEVKEWLKQMGLTEDDYVFYTTTSEMGITGKKNRDAFYNDLDLNNKTVDGKFRIMFAINQYNEGTHVPNLDGVILGRTTQSDIVYFEQIGRGLAVRGKTKEVFDYYETKSIYELKEIAKKRDIEIKDNLQKEDIIELLVAPVIIDLANNIEFIKDLENNLKDRLKLIQSNGLGSKRISHISNPNFDIDMLNQDLFEIVRYMYERMTMTWEDKYELAKAYFGHHHNLEVPSNFITVNGYEEVENGFNLGQWIQTQRRAYNGKGKSKINDKQIQLLTKIGMRWDTKDLMEIWMEKYKLAKAYFDYHHNLEIPTRFITVNGYKEVEDGFDLGCWIKTQRRAYNGKGSNKINDKQIQLLNEIGMRWDNRDLMEIWMKKYKLAKAYFDHYHNLEIPTKFITVNGYKEVEDGFDLGRWISNQRSGYKGTGSSKLNDKQIQLLNEIGMRWDNRDLMEIWMKKYKLAKAYFDHYHNLEIPNKFITVNGYKEVEDGFDLGRWISNQRSGYKGKGGRKLNDKQIQLLTEIGMRWFSDKVDDKLQSEEINDKNIKAKQKEILNRFYTAISKYDDNYLPSKEEINEDFINQLNRKK